MSLSGYWLLSHPDNNGGIKKEILAIIFSESYKVVLVAKIHVTLLVIIAWSLCCCTTCICKSNRTLCAMCNYSAHPKQKPVTTNVLSRDFDTPSLFLAFITWLYQSKCAEIPDILGLVVSATYRMWDRNVYSYLLEEFYFFYVDACTFGVFLCSF